MSAPITWGINPDLLYRWAPSAHTQSPAGLDEKLEACGDLDAAKTEDEKKIIRDKLSQVYRDYTGVQWPINEGAPVLHLAPLPEQLSIELQAAKSLYGQVLYLAKVNLQADIKRVDELDLSEDEKVAAKTKIERDAMEANVRRGSEMYPPALVSKVLAACVKDWENFCVPFSGKWERDGKVIPKEFKEEAFLDIERGSLFTQPEAEGFTLRPGSGPG